MSLTEEKLFQVALPEHRKRPTGPLRGTEPFAHYPAPRSVHCIYGKSRFWITVYTLSPRDSPDVNCQQLRRLSTRGFACRYDVSRAPAYRVAPSNRGERRAMAQPRMRLTVIACLLIS
jgi:hypothetical protein